MQVLRIKRPREDSIPASPTENSPTTTTTTGAITLNTIPPSPTPSPPSTTFRVVLTDTTTTKATPVVPPATPPQTPILVRAASTTSITSSTQSLSSQGLPKERVAVRTQFANLLSKDKAVVDPEVLAAEIENELHQLEAAKKPSQLRTLIFNLKDEKKQLTASGNLQPRSIILRVGSHEQSGSGKPRAETNPRKRNTRKTNAFEHSQPSHWAKDKHV
eukprot:PhF_6_TR21930/c0_g1_i1/m.31159